MSALFSLHAPYQPAGDQPQAIAELGRGLSAGQRFQTLEGVTGSGKTFTIANVIERWGKPTLIVSHNKTLAAQLFQELKTYFPANAVEYFISYYDYYQPEAYIPQTDTYIEKDAAINEDIERLRLSATNALMNRADVIIVASVSCIYGLGSPEDYRAMVVTLQRGQRLEREDLMRRLVDIQYTRNDYDPQPGTFRVRGDTLDIFPSYSKDGVRAQFDGDELESLEQLDTLTGATQGELMAQTISPAKHFVTSADRIAGAEELIRAELQERVAWFEAQGKLLEAQRLQQRTLYDLEMLKEMGYCAGIENYSRHLSGRRAGEPPATLLDYFPGEFLTVLDESHVTLPQLRGMFNGDQARKNVLIEHGFRLPSARDNRPLNFEEFLARAGPIICMTATPGPYERACSPATVPQIIRPTGLLDPEVAVRPLPGQIDDLIEEVRARSKRRERVLVTTLSKKTAEDLSDYLRETGLRVTYLHSDIDALERVEVLRSLRKGEVDCLVGVNLLREGLDLPEVSLVAILDADKEGFLRSETSLIQTAGRAARHKAGRVILYADTMTDSMRSALSIMKERRARQAAYNRQHGITPKSIQKSIRESLVQREDSKSIARRALRAADEELDIHEAIQEIKREMLEAAEALEFERAAVLRDQLFELERALAPAAAGRAPGKKNVRQGPLMNA
ncbi:MAG: excinuclease ABC subunit UvrB [Lentisphaerae bacterium]|nr:excinuclease ABC subunit UvrB [Lentisphaerota bacterium]